MVFSIVIYHHRKKVYVAWYWNLRFEMRCIFKYLLEQYNMVYHVSVCSFLLLAENVPVLFSHKASSESNCNRNFQGRPAGQNRLIVVMCTSTRILNQFIGLYFNRVTPYTHFCIALYSQFSYKLESLLLRVLFFIWIRHDDGIVVNTTTPCAG